MFIRIIIIRLSVRRSDTAHVTGAESHLSNLGGQHPEKVLSNRRGTVPNDPRDPEIPMRLGEGEGSDSRAYHRLRIDMATDDQPTV